MNINVTGEVDEGDYVAFTCGTSGIDCNPELTIVKWTKDGQDIEWSETSFTQIIEVTATDHGKYGCMVANVIKRTPTYSDLSGLVELKVKEGKANYCRYILTFAIHACSSFKDRLLWFEADCICTSK